MSLAIGFLLYYYCSRLWEGVNYFEELILVVFGFFEEDGDGDEEENTRDEQKWLEGYRAKNFSKNAGVGSGGSFVGTDESVGADVR